MEKLFSLDVDDDIWQDIGLTETDGSTDPPLWLCNEQVRAGIKAMLEMDRCLEEEPRLQLEHQSLQEWFAEEWAIVKRAIDATGMFKYLRVYGIDPGQRIAWDYCTS